MSRIKLNLSINNLTEKSVQVNEYIGKKENNKIYYKDDNICVTILLDGNKINMVRKNEEYDLSLNFDQEIITSGIYNIKEVGEITLDIITKQININNNQINIEYTLKTNGILIGEFVFDLSYEVI